MKIHLIALGERMPAWVRQGFDDYAKRMSGEIKIVLREIATEKRKRNHDLRRLIKIEGERMFDAIPFGAHVVALDAAGKQWDSKELSQALSRWLATGKDLTLLIGGPEGLSSQCKVRSEEIWCLSRLTFPHPLARIIVVEQLYRAWSVLRNHPYHRA